MNHSGSVDAEVPPRFPQLAGAHLRLVLLRRELRDVSYACGLVAHTNHSICIMVRQAAECQEITLATSLPL